MSERRRSELERLCSGFGMHNSVHAVGPLQQGENVAVQRGSRLKEGFVRWMVQVLVREKVSRRACWAFGGMGAQSLAEKTRTEGMYVDEL